MKPAALLLALVIVAGCSAPNQRASTLSPTSVEESIAPRPQPTTSAPTTDLSGKPLTLTTADGLTIHGTLYHPDAPTGIMLLHMLGRDQSTYSPIIPELARQYAVLAIDLRGHGASDGNLTAFTSTDFKEMVLDVKAGRAALPQKNIAIIGASIGANTALRYANEDSSVKTVVLLSPGLDYRGVTTADAMQGFNRPVLLVAAKGDAYSYQSVQELSRIQPAASVEYVAGAGHGTDLFRDGPRLKNVILAWLEKHAGEY